MVRSCLTRPGHHWHWDFDRADWRAGLFLLAKTRRGFNKSISHSRNEILEVCLHDQRNNKWPLAPRSRRNAESVPKNRSKALLDKW
jgi:hypothetical protein